LSKSGVIKLETGDFTAFYRKYAALVHRRCLRLLGNEARADEATQDVFVKLLQVQDTLRAHPQPSALLYRVATHVCLNLIRSMRRRPETLDGDLLLELADSQTENFDQTDRLFVQRILEDEEVSTRMMAIAHFVDGMTLEEVSDEFGMSVSGIRKRLQKFKASAQRKDISHEKVEAP
jgi:RNA polymerase sigma-70 factor (ECF subfamily)